MKRLRDTYLRDDLTGGKRAVPVKLSDLTALIASADELEVALRELRAAGVEDAGGERWAGAMQQADEVLEILDKRDGPLAGGTEAPETTL